MPMPEPTPPRQGAINRMELYDRLPRELRMALGQSTYGHTDLMVRAYEKWRAGVKIKTIVQWIANSNLKRESNAPAEREAAQAFLKDLGR